MKSCEPVLGELVWEPVPGNLLLGTLLGNLLLGTLLGNVLGNLTCEPVLGNLACEPCVVRISLLRPAPRPLLWLKTPSLRCRGIIETFAMPPWEP